MSALILQYWLQGLTMPPTRGVKKNYKKLAGLRTLKKKAMPEMSVKQEQEVATKVKEAMRAKQQQRKAEESVEEEVLELHPSEDWEDISASEPEADLQSEIEALRLEKQKLEKAKE